MPANFKKIDIFLGKLTPSASLPPTPMIYGIPKPNLHLFTHLIWYAMNMPVWLEQSVVFRDRAVKLLEQYRNPNSDVHMLIAQVDLIHHQIDSFMESVSQQLRDAYELYKKAFLCRYMWGSISDKMMDAAEMPLKILSDNPDDIEAMVSIRALNEAIDEATQNHEFENA